MNKTAQSVWENCLSFIKDNIQEQAYKTWFEPIKSVELSDNALYIQVPSKFFYEWLEEHYVKLLKVALTKELGKNAKLLYKIKMENTYGNGFDVRGFAVGGGRIVYHGREDSNEFNEDYYSLRWAYNPFDKPNLPISDGGDITRRGPNGESIKPDLLAPEPQDTPAHRRESRLLPPQMAHQLPPPPPAKARPPTNVPH